MKLTALVYTIYSVIILRAFGQNIPNATIEPFCKKVYECIAQNNLVGFKGFWVDKKDFAEFNTVLPYKNEDLRKKALAKTDTLVMLHQKRMENAFQKIQKNANEAGIQWNECEYQGYRIIKQQGARYDIAIQFVYKKIGNYEIHLNDCYNLKKGWIIWKTVGGPW